MGALSAGTGRSDKCGGVGDLMKSSVVVSLEPFSAAEPWLDVKQRGSVLPADVDPEPFISWTLVSRQ